MSMQSEHDLSERLRRIDLFATLDGESLAQVAAGVRRHGYAAGETVFWEGEPAAGLYFLEAGWLKVVRTSPAGREQVVKFLEPGETFNEIGALANRPNPATAVALEDAEVWVVQREALLALLAERPAFARHVVERLAERVLHLVDLVADLSLRSVNSRLANLLLESTIDGVLHRPRWYTQAELAARLGTVPDVVQRSLRQLADEGVIRVERHQIEVLDRAALARIATE